MIIFFPSPVFPLTLSSSSENEHKSNTLPYQEKKINQRQTTKQKQQQQQQQQNPQNHIEPKAHMKTVEESILCWSTTLEHEACPGKVNMPSVTLLRKQILSFPAGISDNSVVPLYLRG